MSALWQIFALVLRAERTALLRGAALSFLVLAMGVALLGLSGWFITAAAAAGLAGTGAMFDVFRPGASVRFLALGRAASRYGERLLTHDATLRALESLRGRLLAGLMAAPHGRMVRLRGAQALNRLTADIDALDGVPLRLVLPLLAGLAAQVATFAVLWWLVGLALALPVLVGGIAGAALIFWLTARRTVPLSRRGEAAAQAFRARMIDLIRARRDLAVQGMLVGQTGGVMAADDRRLTLRRAQDRAERQAGAAIALLSGGLAALALGIGLSLAQAGTLSPALAALGFFASLALGETLAPLRRAAGDLGRMAEAARRVVRDLERPAAIAKAPLETDTPLPLTLEKVTLTRPGSTHPILSELSFTLNAGEALALTGPSGVGKSTLLLAAAGLVPVASGRLALGGHDIADWDETTLRAQVAMLPQRSALMAGTVAEALKLADPEATEAQMWDVLRLVRLDRMLDAREGLQTRIGPRGAGLSGGEGRRLALARVLLRRPRLLLLDEPTEGLDDATARALLADLRDALPHAAILVAAHRRAEVECVDRVHALR